MDWWLTGGGTRCRDDSQQPGIAEHKLWNLLKRTIQNSCYQLNSTRGISWKSWLTPPKSDGFLTLCLSALSHGALAYIDSSSWSFTQLPSWSSLPGCIYPKRKHYAGSDSAVSFPPSVDSGPADNSHGPWESHSILWESHFLSLPPEEYCKTVGWIYSITY